LPARQYRPDKRDKRSAAALIKYRSH